ncbi:MAG: hypothetical protein IT207_10140 [Fimbriimonadaceae bacterium]|nr:hypothetical protein [Fimbriimonadaceae bacterium]
MRNDNPFRLVGTMTLNWAKLVCPGPNTEGPPGSWSNPPFDIPLGFSPATTPVDLAAYGGSQNITYTFSGLPNHVALGDLEVAYDLPLQREGLFEWGENGETGKWTRVFLTDSTPVGAQGIPWADFLEYTCRWAWGAAGASDLRVKMTRGMHYSNRCADRRLLYRYDYPRFAVLQADSTYQYFLGDLTRLLDLPSSAELDCNDFAAGLQLALSSHGTSAEVIVMSEDGTGGSTGFATNPLCQAGDDSTNLGNYYSFPFNYHMVTRSGGETFDTSSSYDFDTLGSPYQNPPTFWAEDPHWRSWVGGEDYGLVDDSLPIGSTITPLVPRPVIPISQVIAGPHP